MSELHVRPARLDDYASFATLFPALQTGDAVPSAQRWHDEMSATTLIAERADRVLGYAYFQLLGATGYIRNVVVAPQARGAGVGAALMDALRRHFQDHRAQTWELNVKPDNQPAIRLYERCGMQVQHRATALGVRWASVAALPRPELRVTTRLVRPDEDARFEQALKLLAGQLSGSRALSGRIIVGLCKDADDTPAGVALFDPGFPGAYPFRVIHPSLVGALLAGIQAHAPQPLAEQLGLFIENDAAAVATLIAGGATVRLEALHYRGVL